MLTNQRKIGDPTLDCILKGWVLEMPDQYVKIVYFTTDIRNINVIKLFLIIKIAKIKEIILNTVLMILGL